MKYSSASVPKASLQLPETPYSLATASGTGSAEKKKRAPKPAASEPAAVKEERKAITLPEVRTILAGKCAAGFGTQVKALIESYGASTLKEVPAEKYEELLEAVAQLGGDADAG